MMLRWNQNYAQFSKAYFDYDAYSSESILLERPELVAQDSKLFFPSAFWQYMTPHFPKSSAHELISGMFQPNSLDTSMKVGANFGSTIAALAQDDPQGLTSECFTGSSETPQALLRAEIYSFLLTFFGLDAEDDLGCALTRQINGGSGTQPSFWYYKDAYKC